MMKSFAYCNVSDVKTNLMIVSDSYSISRAWVAEFLSVEKKLKKKQAHSAYSTLNKKLTSVLCYTSVFFSNYDLIFMNKKTRQIFERYIGI